MLGQRVASAVVGVPLIVLLILIGGRWYTAAAALIVLVATIEFQAAHRGGRRPLAWLAGGLAAALVAGAHVGFDWVLWFTVGSALILLLWVTLRGDPQPALEDWLWAVGGILYVGLLGSHFVLLRQVHQDAEVGRDWVLLAVFATFATDTSAYFVGRAWGRRPLAERISPGKTVEGALGGLAGGVGAALLLNYFLGLRLEAALVAPLALLIPLAAIAGDLVESMVKRGMQIKDTSQLIPGHGGLLDRLDSLLFTFPVIYYFVTWVVP